MYFIIFMLICNTVGVKMMLQAKGQLPWCPGSGLKCYSAFVFESKFCQESIRNSIYHPMICPFWRFWEKFWKKIWKVVKKITGHPVCFFTVWTGYLNNVHCTMYSKLIESRIEPFFAESEYILSQKTYE